MTAKTSKQMKEELVELLREKHEGVVVQQLLSLNPKTYHDHLASNIITKDLNYYETIRILFTHYRKAEDIARQRFLLQKEEHEAKKVRQAATSTMPEVLMAEKLQKIRLDQAREQEIWLKNAQTRGELCSREEIFKMLEPFILSQKSMLVQAALTNPALQSTVDKCLDDLYDLGERIASLAKEDSDSYVKFMCEKEVDLAEVNSSLQLTRLLPAGGSL